MNYKNMKELVNIIPIPMSGLMLGTAIIGNLLSPYGNIFKILFGSIALILLILLVLKVIWDTKTVLDSLKNPAIAGIVSTFPMGIIVLSTYIHSFLPLLACATWITGTLIYCTLSIYFSKNFLFKFNIQNVYPSWFVAYVGIGVVSITAPVMNFFDIGKLIFWVALTAYIILLPTILYRVLKIKSIPEPILPIITIFAAPASLCLSGYMNSFQEKNIIIIWILLFLSIITLFFVLLYMPRMLKKKFFPSYSAFTFPLAITAISIKSSYTYFINMNMVVPGLKFVMIFEEALAISFVLYVLIRYMVYIYLQYVENVASQLS